MFKFSKNEDLLATIEKQKEQIGRYEGRLRDVVHAYKSLQNEKEALENSMKALTSVAPNSSIDKKRKNNAEPNKKTAQAVTSDHDDESVDDSASDSQVQSHESESEFDEVQEEHSDDEEEEDSSIQHLRSQVFTLTQSLSTMSAEKAKIVATYQAEKKKLKQEQEVQTRMLQEENVVYSKKTEMLEDELAKVKEKVRGQQIDREQEQATHSIMLREIQRMLNDERNKNESLELIVKELRNAAQTAEIEVQQSEDYKRRVRQLEEELNNVRRRLHAAEQEANTPSPLLLQLQEEMEHMKKDHKVQLEKEHARVAEIEQRERAVAHAEEERVADLENRLIQISNKMGLYDGKRQKDQISIQHLKDRIAQFDIENALLSKQLEAAKSYEEQVSSLVGKTKLDEDLDISGLKEQIMRYQHLLKEAANKSNEPVDLSDVVMSLQSDSEDYQKLYLASQQELLQLKEEFERYKTRAQNVLKNMKGGQSSTGSSISNREVEEMRRQLQEARERHFHLRSRCDDLEAKCVQMTADHQMDSEKQAVVHRSQIDGLNEKHARSIGEKDRETRTQRERTVAMLADKDKEIKQLKIYMSTYHSEYQNDVHFMDHEYQAQRRFSGNDDAQDAAEESVTEILNKGSANETNIIHYVEQLARKDVVINSIRRHKKQLELQIRQLQDASIMKDEKNAQDLAELKEKIMEQERGKLRGNANMEYLKNVLYRYLTTADYTAKERMLVAIVTILQFSPEESIKAGVKR